MLLVCAETLAFCLRKKERKKERKEGRKKGRKKGRKEERNILNVPAVDRRTASVDLVPRVFAIPRPTRAYQRRNGPMDEVRFDK